HYSLFTVLCLILIAFPTGCKSETKEPAVAGTFYPAQKDTLREMIDEFLSKAQKGSYSGKLIALISPHAGYQYSGQVAAYSYKQLEKKDIRTVILIGPSHHKAFNGVSVYTKGKFRTPLGDVKINENLAGRLINEKADVVFNHDAFEREHSIEVQIPFLQRVLKDFTIVPILIGSPTKQSFQYLTEKLTEILRKDEKAIMVASTDLSHYHDYETASVMDSKMIDAVERMSMEDIERNLVKREAEMCGAYPVLFTMAVARMLGANYGLLYTYANSGDVTGDKGRVVGYAAMGIYKSELTKEEKEELLSLAKNTIINYVTNGKIPGGEIKNPKFRANGATFVTIKKNGNLRGCIGNIQPVMPLYESVIKNAISACSSDPRFPPMNKEDIKDMDVEISILSPLLSLRDVKDIQIGRHGLVIRKGMQSGLLLPQVATEFGWDRDTFLEHICLKAGLPKDAWKDAELYIFTAEIIK
ncbi:MAG: AmmeMemoRadiSam system protein B, partial [Nitrospira sp.]|nr:AmmeMemoRadiSam system protein B [Nitrospira sp.]